MIGGRSTVLRPNGLALACLEGQVFVLCLLCLLPAPFLRFCRLSLLPFFAANLREANLNGADLNGANLSGANLSGATGWTEEQLAQASSLGRAIMPNGQEYEDWLKSKGRGEDGEGSGPA
jgi:uncharacterized protein YjbI with pentapeptide repeats